MDSVSTNPYEQQLYTVFKSFDIDNAEALDKVAVLDLCDALQLEDRGVTLANTLFERRSDRVTFEQFRNGLLSVLSGGERLSEVDSSAAEAAPAHSDEDSGREVAPKFVFGAKKYGRRSRPQRASSASRLDAEQRRHRSAQRARYRRSASAMESRDVGVASDDEDSGPELDHDRRVDCERALALCRELRMDGIDRSVVERIFEEADDGETTVGEFFDRLNMSLTSSIEGARGGLVGPADDEEGDEDGTVASETLVDEWERVGVPRPRRLLLRLGFAAPTVPLVALDEALEPGPAALAVARLRLARSRRRADRTAAERDRMCADLAAAERRARLLAADVDEAQARSEARLEERARRTEARLADEARRASAEAASERERSAELVVRLEEQAAQHAEAETRARTELEAERVQVERLVEQLAVAEERAAAAEQLAAARATEARTATVAPAPTERVEEATLRMALAAAEAELRRLRDREDELSAALCAGPARTSTVRSPCEDLSEELRALLDPDTDPEPIINANDLTGVSPQNMNTEKFSDQKCETCSIEIAQMKTHVNHLVQLSSHVKCQDVEVQTDTLENGTASTDINYEDDRQKYLDIIRELEESLELMREEYERCEEYWARKLQEERAEQETERRASDERLAALLRRVADCERRFTLPPIPEREALEAQVAALEQEHTEQLEALRREHSAQLAAAAAAAASRQRPQRARTCCCAESTAALVSRAARADAALRRLGARLRAADALVADLYVENCRLQHRAPPP